MFNYLSEKKLSEMSSDENIAHRLIQIAANASNQSTSEERNFSSLIQSTRRNFRKQELTSTPRRGRIRQRTFKRKVVLMKLSNADFFPSNPELKFLKQRGLGEANTLLEIQRDSSCEEIKNSIILLFHPHIQHMLRMCGIAIGKMQQNKKIIHVDSFDNGSDLENEIGQSKIVVLPLKDFPNDLPILTDEDFVPRPLSHTDSNLSPTRASVVNRTRDVARNVNNPEQSSPSTLPNATPRERRHSTRTWRQRMEEMEEEKSDADDDYHLRLTEEFDPANNFVLFPSLPENVETAIIDISRTNCLNELMSLYTDEHLLSKNLNVKFIGEIGIDGGGLTKELFNIFFDKCSGMFFKGEDCLVPYLPLVTDPYLTNEENEVLHYLIMYINCLDKDNLLRFIFLITASYQMPNAINITFNDSVGLSQRPIFTTCTDTLILPKTYSNYNELKNDLNICLHTEEVKEYTSY